ncbi:MAG: DinB family protein [Dehalococcoidia bacterium]|nr:MAG: DinB family protein [Dehalococcoidia bacterium]
MDVKDFALQSLDESQTALMQAVDGLSQEELMRLPQPGANHIAFILWHMVRAEDWFFHYLFQRVPQVWESERWHEKLNLPDDPRVTGFGYTAEQVASFPSVPLRDLIAYGEAVRASTVDYLRSVDPARFDEIVKSRLFGEVSIGNLIGHLLLEIAQHVGQIAYIRGLVTEQSR